MARQYGVSAQEIAQEIAETLRRDLWSAAVSDAKVDQQGEVFFNIAGLDDSPTFRVIVTEA